MSEGQTQTATTTGTQGDAQSGAGITQKTTGANRPASDIGGHPKIQKAISGNASGVPGSNAGTQEGAAKTQDGSNAAAVEVDKNNSSRIKLKVYGKERELDFNDPDHRQEIQRRLQMDVAAEQRLAQATEMQKRVDQLTRLANNPNASPQQRIQNVGQLLQAFGYGKEDSLEVSKALVAEKIKQEMMDPRERALIDERQKRESIEKQLQQRADQERTQYETAIRQQKSQKWEADIMKALDNTKDLPASPTTVRLLAQNLYDAKNNGIEMTAEEAAHATKSQVGEFVNDLLGQMTVPQIAKMLGSEFIDKIRSHAIEELRAPLNQQFAKKPDAKQNQFAPSKERKWKSWAEKQEELNRRVLS